MESSSLFNPDFTGSAFRWWIGQIPDDSYWRDNITPTKYDDPSSPTGWGYRYKVKIIGLHDPDTESIETDQLPWANVMYPVTAGGGQQSSFQTPNIRQGMFVFGFFLDGSDMQVPIIMGVLGNNSKTELAASNPDSLTVLRFLMAITIPQKLSTLIRSSCRERSERRTRVFGCYLMQRPHRML